MNPSTRMGRPTQTNTRRHQIVAYLTQSELEAVADAASTSNQTRSDWLRGLILKELEGEVKKQPPDLTAGEFNRREC